MSSPRASLHVTPYALRTHAWPPRPSRKGADDDAGPDANVRRRGEGPSAWALRSEARTRALARAVSGSVLCVDRAGRLKQRELDFEKYTGQSERSSAQQGIVGAVHPDDVDAFRSGFRAGVRSEETFALEVRLWSSAAQQFRRCTLRASPVLLEPASVDEWMVVISEREPASSVEVKKAASEETARAIGAVAGGVAHQLNNVLHGVLGHAELLERHLPLSSAGRENLKHVRSCAQRGAAFCAQLLAIAGKAALSPERCDLRDLLNELTPEPELEKVTLSFARSSAPCVVRADGAQLRRCVIALLRNSVEASRERTAGVVVTVGERFFEASELEGTRPSGVAPAGRYAFIEVRDDGPGIAPDLLPGLFEPFYANKFTGRGMGLPVVLGTVRSMGGVVDLSTEEGRGTRVRILLPSLRKPRILPLPGQASAAR